VRVLATTAQLALSQKDATGLPEKPKLLPSSENLVVENQFFEIIVHRPSADVPMKWEPVSPQASATTSELSGSKLEALEQFVGDGSSPKSLVESIIPTPSRPSSQAQPRRPRQPGQPKLLALRGKAALQTSSTRRRSGGDQGTEAKATDDELAAPSSPSVEWARKRQAAIAAAPALRCRHLVKGAQLTPLLPPDQGFQPMLGQDAASPVALMPWATKAKGTNDGAIPPCRLRLKKANGIYGVPVWGDFFG